MSSFKFGAVAAVLLLCLQAACDDNNAKKLDQIVKFEFPQDGYHFTLDEAAKGVSFKYKIVVDEDLAEIIPQRFDPSYHEKPGPAGLYPREAISGNDQNYCLRDFGLGFPPADSATKLKKGTYDYSFAWDGRNWSGPSDTNMPKGKPFPPGTYDIIVTIHGKLVSGGKKVPYEINGKTKLELK